MKKKYQITLLLFSIILVTILGLRINSMLMANEEKNTKLEHQKKFQETLEYISSFYVDDIDWEKSYKSAIEGFLTNLDPHSVYISEEEVELNEENYSGKYQGIGIQFDIIDGYLTVITPISGSPSDKLGLMAGDRIVKIDDESAIGITTTDVQKKLKGAKGTSVNVTVQREGVKDLIEYVIVRDEIPIYTVFTSFMDENKTGYIFLTRFAKTTEQEMEEALDRLENKGMERLILDLRWNPGGFLDQAVRLAGKFIDGHKQVVYTKGRLSQFNDNYFTDTFGSHNVRNYPLIILLNHASASASEILAGAIQDYDRGLIVGTTSFGKGLVQREFPLEDNSRLRLTISKYYTPSGRLIQRPYKDRSLEDYYQVEADSTNEIAEADSIKNEVYYTSNGREVYGGGGITPDFSIEDTGGSKSPQLAQQLLQHRIFFEVGSKYANMHKDLKENFNYFLKNFTITKRLQQSIKDSAKLKEIKIKDEEFNKDLTYINNRLKAEMARSLWDNEKFYQVLMSNDNQYLEATKLFSEAEKIIAQRK